MTDTIDQAKTRMQELCDRWGPRVDYLAIRLEQSEGTDILLRGGAVETLSEAIAIGGHVRACYRGGWGFASFNDLDSLTLCIESAVAAARLVGDDETRLAAIDPVQITQRLPLTGMPICSRG